MEDASTTEDSLADLIPDAILANDISLDAMDRQLQRAAWGFMSQIPGSLHGLEMQLIPHGKVKVGLLYRRDLNFALVHNGIGIFAGFGIAVDPTDAESEATTHRITSIRANLRSGSFNAGQEWVSPDIELSSGQRFWASPATLKWDLDTAKFFELDEATPDVLELDLTIDDDPVHLTMDVRFLAHDQWSPLNIPEAIAAFVQPRSQAVEGILSSASDLLAERVGDPSLLGYQGDEQRVVDTARAIYDSITALNVRYANPPASFEASGQKIRTADTIAKSRFGTCLDTTVLFAAALEEAGLQPYIVLLAGHAFVGFALTELSTPPAIASEGEIANLFGSGRFVPVETTTATAGKNVSFDDAVLAASKAAQGGANVHFCVDVQAAHRRVMPLPTMTTNEGGVSTVVYVEPATGTAQKDPLAKFREVGQSPSEERQESHLKLGAEGVPLRVQKWRSDLLDLSLRNPLLKLSSGRGVQVLLPEADIPALEDLLAGNHRVELTPDDMLDEIEAQRGLESAAQLPAATLTSLFNEEGRVFVKSSRGRTLSKLNSLRREAKSMLEESGSNALHLAIGFLRWPVKSGSGAKQEGFSPLFLLPIEITGSASRPYSIRMEPNSELQPNYALIEKLRQEYGMTIPLLEQPPTDDSGIDVARIFEELRRQFLENGLGFSVDGSAQLAIVKFGSLDMWRDVGSNWRPLAQNDIVDHLIFNAGNLLPGAANPVHVDPADEALSYLPLPADGSQLESVKAASAGESFVLEGPPGTGKSQTIANIIADGLAHGQSILFVAEKQAALEVVEDRLDSVGLKPLTLNAHGVGQGVNKVREQLRSAATAQAHGNRIVFDNVRAELKRVITDLETYPSSVHGKNDSHAPADHSQEPPSIWEAYQQCAVLERQAPAKATWRPEDIDVPTGLLAVSHEHVDRLVAEVERARTKAHGELPSSNWSLVGADFRALDPGDLEHLLSLASDLLDTVEAVPQGVFHILVSADDEQRGLFMAWLEDVATGEGLLPDALQEPRLGSDAVLAQRRNLQAFVSAWGEFAAQLGPAAMTLNPQNLQRELEAAQASGVFGRKKKVNAVLNRVLALALPGTDLYDSIATGDAAYANMFLAIVDAFRRDEWRARNDVGMTDALKSVSLLGDHAAAEIEQRYEREAGHAKHVTTLRSFMDSAPELLSTFESLAEHHQRPLVTGQVLRLLEHFVAAWSDLCRAAAVDANSLALWLTGDASTHQASGAEPSSLPLFDRRVPGRVVACMPEWRATIADDEQRSALLRQLRLQSALAGLNRVGLDTVANRIAEGADTVGLHSALQLAVARERLAIQLRRHDLEDFDGTSRVEAVQKYLRLGDRLRELTKKELPAQVMERRGTFQPSVGLRKELDRKRGGSIRRLFEQFSDEIIKLTPVVLMSPTTVARSLPIGTITFDKVIFDEASQVRVADAIGAIGRAKSVVIVGDSKQMPPTSAFSASGPGDDDESFDAPDRSPLAGEAKRLVQLVDAESGNPANTATDDKPDLPVVAATDQESILSEAANTGLPRKWLRWHYRSQHDSLISFSNAKYYEGHLQVFPGPPDGRPGFGVGVRRVSGVFDGGAKGTRTNELEAQSVVAEIASRLRNDPEASIGVVTFNTQQRDLILDLMEQSDAPEVRTSLERAIEPVFVKNLESVQGDERDVILFSIAFSRNPETGRLSHNFGPLNNSGGERRLNVAVTRARKQVVVFTSIRASDINPAKTSAQGVLDLRDYLAAAETGQAFSGNAEVPGAAVDMFRMDLASALSAAGLETREDVGTSDFRVDLAVRSGSNHGWVGLLLDSPEWAGRLTTSDRTILPSRVLQGVMGWDATAQVLLVDWIIDRSAVVERLTALAHDTAKTASSPLPSEAHDVTPSQDTHKASSPDAETSAELRPSSGAEPAQSVVSEDRATPEQHSPLEEAPVYAAKSGAVTDVSAEIAPALPATETAQAASSVLPAVSPKKDGLDASGEYPFVEASNEAIGAQVVLNELSKRTNKSLIAAQIDDIVQVEGPIQADRLAKLVGNRFGFQRVSTSRKQQILGTSARKPERMGELGDFYWPDGMDPQNYTGYRPRYDADTVLGIDEINHVELGNVMLAALTSAGPEGMETEELVRGVMEMFGWSRLGSRIKLRMKLTIGWLADKRRITVDVGGTVRLVRSTE